MSHAGLQLGHYRLLHQVGGGAMGEIYLAEDTRLPRQVAIKIIRSEASSYPHSEDTKELERLFQREMQAITRLDHPHILPLFDFGEERIQNMTYMYMVMPYRAEGSFSDWLRTRTSHELLAPQDVAHVVSQAADALQHAHDQQLIHQDVKPSNFLIRNRTQNANQPDLLLADFGIAKISSTSSTTSQSVRGTPAYMPPEQWNGQPVPASDQYALAIMVYQLLTGQFPFQGGPGQMMHAHFTAQPPVPSALNPRISPALDAVLLRALAKNPAERFPSIAAFAQAFQQAQRYAGELRATLTIRQAEAQAGTSRTLTLPGKRQITVYVPAGAQNGQELRVNGQGETYYEGGPRGFLVLTISLAANDAHAPLAHASDAFTVASSSADPAPFNPLVLSSHNAMDTIPPTPHHPYNNPYVLHQSSYTTPETPMNPMNPIPPAPLIAPPPYPNAQPPSLPPRKRSTGFIALIIGVVLLVIVVSSGVLIYNANSYQATTTNDNTARQTADAASHGNTVTAQTNATASAVAGTTATVVAQNPSPYSPNTRKLTLIDPLSQPYLWQDYANTSFGGSCQFKNGAYHVIQTKPVNYYYCSASTPNFGDATFEVQMTILQGDCGGITFHSNPIANQLYFFRVCVDGAYGLYLYVNSSGDTAKALLKSTSSTIRPGLKQSNTLAIVTTGSMVELYINKQKVDSIADTTYGKGLFGIVANSTTGLTDVAYSNARLWT